MKHTVRLALLGLLPVLAVVAGWRVVKSMRPGPEAQLALAEQQLARGQEQAAQERLQQLLTHEPVQGRAYALLARIAEKQGNAERTLALYQLAARHAPRDQYVRLWLAQHTLKQQDYAAALDQIDSLLRLNPSRANSVYPALVQLAQDPKFAQALAGMLAGDPPWRTSVLAALRNGKTGNALATDQVMQALQTQGGLSAKEYAEWLDSLMAQGRWGEAYARWAGDVPKPEGRLALLYNGDFRSEPTDVGFDWRRRRVPGVLLQFTQESGEQERSAVLQFLGRRTAGGGLEHPLFLLPGRYQLTLRARAQALRSELGLQWVVACAGPAGIVGRSEALDGSFSWQEITLKFSVPETGCIGQWLRLINPVPSGAAQIVSGNVWFTAFTLRPEV